MAMDGMQLQESAAAGEAAVRRRTASAPVLAFSVRGPETGIPVVLSHALGLDMAMWDDLAADLASTGYRVLCHDHRGHGASAVPPGPYTMDDLVADAARIIRECAAGPVVWVGLSMGGMVGQGLAIRHPELVRGLVLANTTAQYPSEARAGWVQRIRTVEASGMRAIAEMVVERYLHAAFRATNRHVAKLVRDRIRRADAQGYAASCHAVARVDWLAELGTVQVPTLVIAGALDVGAPPSMALAIQQQISRAQLVVLESASHLSVAEQPQQFAALIKDFLLHMG
jgi:3-oxoadipate enol-lactonase